MTPHPSWTKEENAAVAALPTAAQSYYRSEDYRLDGWLTQSQKWPAVPLCAMCTRGMSKLTGPRRGCLRCGRLTAYREGVDPVNLLRFIKEQA